MPKQSAHHVHLGVRRTRVAALLIDFLQDRRCLLQTQPESTESFRNQCPQPAFLRQGLDEGLRILPTHVELAPVGIGKTSAQLANLSPQRHDVVRIGKRILWLHIGLAWGLIRCFIGSGHDASPPKGGMLWRDEAPSHPPQFNQS